MRKHKILFALPLALALFAMGVSAVESSSPTPSSAATLSSTPVPRIRDLMENFQQQRQELRDKIEQDKTALRQLMNARKEQLKQQLAKVKDEKKKQTVERIDNRFEALNEQWTNHFLDVLDQLENILEKITVRLDEASQKGFNVESARVSVQKAVVAIKEARDAVKVQASKSYKITVTSESRLRADVKSVRDQLNKDLTGVREKVKMARDAVHDVAVELAKARGKVSASPSASPASSASVSPSPSASVAP
jgi:exonuclease VII large subunit